ncbi:MULTISPECIES: hypothetical protein [unclassified Nostoc]|uniref:hypothetical protein n=1 Tax=unclassified Nostoc TaxID=2593658 RepID=UPI0016826C75|nr:MULTISPECIES: hypothetical protein [unclassified Nostoc]
MATLPLIFLLSERCLRQGFAKALNILRRNGHTSITIAQRFLSHDIDKLLALVE